jgi:hypothetical protein
VGDDFEFFKRGRSEACGDRDVSGITPTRYHDPADSRMVMSGIKREPSVAQVNLKPRTEIHWRRIRIDQWRAA